MTSTMESPSSVKYSRYRSGKSRRLSEASSPPKMPTMTPQNSDVPLARSRSRYRRTRPGTASGQPQAPSPPSPPRWHPAAAEDPFKTPPISRKTSYHTQHSRSSSRDQSPPPVPTLHAPQIPEDSPPSDPETNGPTGTRSPAEQCPQHDEACPDRRQTEQPDLGQISAEPLPLRDEQINVNQAGKERKWSFFPARASTSPPEKGPKKERFAFLSGTRHKSTPPPSSQAQPTKDIDHRWNDADLTIEPGGGGIVPGIDAPISAVNAGERRVKIKCNDAVINLPVNPDTTPMDLIYASTSLFKQPIIPEASILVESYFPLGLERPLRKYEHIRDVMNSWDRDTQNGFILVSAEDHVSYQDLDASSVPFEQPGDLSVFMYYSQKPGKWDKRWITLRSDGQVYIAKKPGAKDKDVTNICHLSDFDVYGPTRRQLKTLKVSKKQCLAVKSQQRSSMFLSTTNFVHFFATDDKALAAQWYKAVQEWRSWYLINKVGVPPSNPTGETRTQRNADAQSVHHAGSMRLSTEVQQNHLISGQMDVPSNAPGAARTSRAQAVHAQKLAQREKRAPPLSFSNKLTKERSGASISSLQSAPHIIQGPSPQTDGDETFSPTGLLGRSYSQRQRQQRQRELASNQEGPFVSGPSLLASAQQTTRNQSVRSKHEPPGLKNSSSQPQLPRPLIDFSNASYGEPLQHAKKGRGYVPETGLSGGLVDVATPPEVALPVLSSSSRRRPVTSSGTTTHDRTKTMAAQAPPVPQNPFSDASPDEDQEGFTGLLARTGQSQGGSGRGRGVMSGDRYAKSPMLDMREAPQFAPGSLLAESENDGSDIRLGGGHSG